jgi:PAS domain S-box-containing protein
MRVDRIHVNAEREPAIVLICDVHGRILDANGMAEHVFGSSARLAGQELLAFLSPDSRAQVEEYFSGDFAGLTANTLHLDVAQSDGNFIGVLASLSPLSESNSTRRVRLLGLVDAERRSLVAELESRAVMLAGFIEASSEAMWCMEFTEPVDLRVSEEEIIRQVFENDCHWRMCNAAMARLYSLPADMDFNRQPVAAYFRRIPENEAFVRQLIRSRFQIDAAPTLEYGHDGRMFFGENSVRCQIEHDQIIRMWGIVRDVTELRQSQKRLEDKERTVTQILRALPDAVLVVDISRRVMAINPAFEATFGWTADRILGQDISPILDLEARGPGESRWFAQINSRWIADVADADGRTIRCDIRMAPLPSDTRPQFVLSMRTVQPTRNELGQTKAWRAPRARRRTVRQVK